MDYTVHGILQARILEWAAFPFSRGSSRPRDPMSPELQADSLQADPQRRPKNIGLGSLTLLWQIRIPDPGLKLGSPAMQETWVQPLGLEDPLEKGKAAHSSILACRIPWII